MNNMSLIKVPFKHAKTPSQISLIDLLGPMISRTYAKEFRNLFSRSATTLGSSIPVESKAKNRKIDRYKVHVQ